MSGRDIEVISAKDIHVTVQGQTLPTHPFMDRANYYFNKKGDYSSNCVFIRPSNDDKNTYSYNIQTILTVPFASTVYLDFWGGSTHLVK